MSAGHVWTQFAAALSGRGRLRLSKDGGRTYPRRYERTISAELPNQPAAVLIYDAQGCAHTFVVDLDVSKGGVEAVERDLSSVRALLSRLGLPHFADRSPNGGAHVYVPLADPLPHYDASAVARALAARTPTMDPMPMLSGVDDACIRPPGARHRTGGHQQLVDPLEHAVATIASPATAAAWRRLSCELSAGEHAGPLAPTPAAATGGEERLTARGRHTEPDAGYRKIATTGLYDTDRYATPSEARQGVVWACVAAGWAFDDVARNVSNGTWPGLASLYARYRPGSRHGALVRDWRSAIAHEKRRRGTTHTRSVRVGTTSAPETHGGGVYRWIRSWLNVVRLTQHTERDALATRAVLYALAEAAMKAGSTTIAFGHRSLAEATGLNQATVGKILRNLAEVDRPLIALVEEGRSVHAHTWALQIPDDLGEQAHSTSWTRGKIHAIRPAFHDLGHAAAFVYAALEQANEPLSGRQLASDAGMGHTAAYDALDTLAAFDLARRTPAGWIIGAARLDDLAEQFGALDKMKAVHAKHRAEREAWWAWLGVVRFPVEHRRHSRATAPPPDELEPPPEPGWTALDLIERELGGYVIAEDRTA